MSDVYKSMDYRMSLVHAYGKHNSRRPTSTLMPLAYINVRLDALAEHIITEFLLPPATRNTIAIGLSDPHRIPRVSIHVELVKFNISQSITCKISKLWLLQH